MPSSKHSKGKSPFRDDLERNPGIAQSKGTFATGEPVKDNAGESTLEGDLENDTTVGGGVSERPPGRTNP